MKKKIYKKLKQQLNKQKLFFWYTNKQTKNLSIGKKSLKNKIIK